MPKNQNLDMSPQDIVSMPEAEVNIAKCPGCGANVAFDPNTQMLRCEYCNTTVDFEKSHSDEKQSIRNLVQNRDGWEQSTKMYSCSNCGAIAVLSKTDIAKECAYCHSTNIVDIGNLSGTKPDAVLPFVIDKASAVQRLKQWIKGKFFAPKSFKTNFSPQDLRGVYNPVFVFDSNTFSSYSGYLGEYYTVTVGSGKDSHTEIRTRWFKVSGPHYDNFVDVTIQASAKISQSTMSKLAPFGVSEASAYSDSFLQGFSANHYDKDGLQCWDDAKLLIDGYARKNIMSSLRTKYRYDVVGKFNIKTQCYNINYKYALLPVYVGHSKYGNKSYNCFVNGYTGKVAGKVPVSQGKVWAVIGIGLAIVAALAGVVAVVVNGG